MSSQSEPIDLFEHEELQPAEVRAVFEKYEDDYANGATYGLNERVLAELKPLGYTFEYGLDADPYDLHKIGDREEDANV